MYKDVGKKFGMKVLIVLCSVLLLGGVAIAAPKLRAAGEEEITSFSTSELKGWLTTSGSAIEYHMGGTGMADIPTYTVNPNNGVAQPVQPQRIVITFPDDNKRITLTSEEYQCSDTDLAKLTQAGSTKLVISGVPGKTKLTGGGTVELDYKIAKATLGAYSLMIEAKDKTSYENRTATDLVVTNKNYSIRPADLDVWLENTSGNKISISEGQYQITEPAGDKTLGIRPFTITLKNYKTNASIGDDDKGASDWSFDNTLRVVKDIDAQLITLDGNEKGSGLADVNERTKVEVYDREDLTNVLRENTSYNLIQGEDKDSGKFLVRVTGLRDGGYVGRWEKYFDPYVEEITSTIADRYGNRAFDYDEDGGGSYMLKPELHLVSASFDETLTAAQYEPIKNGYQMVERVQEDGKWIYRPLDKNATAGTVEMKADITDMNSRFFGRTVTVYYTVKRDISKAVFDPPTARKSDDNFMYDGTTSHYMDPQIFFKDASDNKLEMNTDFTVSYELQKREDEDYASDRITGANSVIYAGKVWMIIKGKLNPEENPTAGGYYGTLDSTDDNIDHMGFKNGSYEIKPMPIDSSKYHLVLNGKKGVPEYDLTGSSPDVETGTRIEDADGNRIQLGAKNVEYVYEFFRDEACETKMTSEDWNKSGRYWVRFKFIGNYSQSLKAEFELHSYNADEIEISFKAGECEAGCPDADENGGGHVYNGMAHEPTVIVTPTTGGRKEPLEEGAAYTVAYSPNVNAGKVTVTVTLTGTETNNTKTKEFTIAQQSLKDADSLELPEPDYAPNDAGIIEHEYSGKTQAPDLQSLTFKKGSLNLPMYITKPEDSTAEDYPYPDFVKGSLYEETGSGSGWQKVNFPVSALKLKTNYRFEIEGSGNYKDKGFTQSFQFKKRHIKNADLSELDAMTDADETTLLKSILEYIKQNLELTDEGTKLKISTDTTQNDYIITIKEDKRAEDGTVVFTITGDGFYEGSIDKTVNIGKDIKDTLFYEKRSPRPIVDRVVELKSTYPPNSGSGDAYNLPFMEGAADEDEQLMLYLTTNETRPKKLYRGSKYLVTKFGTMEEENPDGPGRQWCTAEIAGINGYYGTLTIKFEISREDIRRCTIEITENRDGYLVYTGTPREPKVTVKKEDGSVLDPKYYDLSYELNIDATTDPGRSKAKVIATGRNGYKEHVEQTFDIEKRALNNDGAVQKQMSSLFRTDIKKSYKYTTTSTVETPTGTMTVNGVCPQIGIEFDWEGFSDQGKEYVKLELNKDFELAYQKNKHVYDSSDPKYKDKESPVVVVTAIGHNYTGKCEIPFNIEAINLREDCRLELSNNDEVLFSGGRVQPEVTVYLNKDNSVLAKVNNTDEEAGAYDEYKIETFNDIFVPDGTSALPRVVVTATAEGNCISSLSKEYKIIGDLNPNEKYNPGGKANSALKYGNVSTGNPDGQETTRIPYQSSDPIAIANLRFMQRLDGDDTSWRERRMDVDKDYSVELVNRSIGPHMATVTGKGYFTGSTQVPVTIQADLKGSYMEYDYPEVFAYSGQPIQFDKLIKVKCGEEALVYGTHYVFAEGTPSSELGKHTLTIDVAPGIKDMAVPYLTGTYTIEYEVKAGLAANAVISIGDPDKTTFTYAHGDPVINERDIIVKVNDTVLTYKDDYTVTIDDAVNCGTHTITVEGIGKYSGESTKTFTIEPYDIKNGVKVAYKDTVTYNGHTVFPDVTAVTVTTNLGVEKTLTLKSEEAAGDYEIAAGTGDQVNWTHDPAAKPTFVVKGVGNYKGEISQAYSIARRNIKDEGVKFSVQDQSYQNGREIRPVPQGTYNSKDLVGVVYEESKADEYLNSSDTTKDFAYEFVTKDLKNIGTKTIRIQGIGNFYDETTITFEVKPLNLEETELTFTSETQPVYDSTPQHPAFQLTFNGDVILVYTGTTAVSDYIKPNIRFENEINAGTATVTVSMDEGASDNYIGSKSATFTIQPAPLTDHTKFMYHPAGQNGNVDLSSYKLNLPFNRGNSVSPVIAGEADAAELKEAQLGIYYDFSSKANHGAFLKKEFDYEITYEYVEPDTDDVPVREEYSSPKPPLSYAGKVKATIKGVENGNYTGSASFWYFIGKDISTEASISMTPTTNVYNSQVQAPAVSVTGVSEGEYKIAKYKNEVAVENLISDKGFVNAGQYFIRIEGDPANGTYSTKPHTLTYTITPRPISSEVVIDGFQKEYSFTGHEICPIGISVTDYIDRVKYKLTENVDYTLSYSNNLNAGTAIINVNGQNNFSGTATARFLITSSTISSNGSNNNSPHNQGIGEISGATAVSPDDVSLSMDTNEAMYYTGSPLYPKVAIKGMTENVDYTVTFSNNVEVGTASVYITGIGNNSGVITKYFNIIAQLSKCTVAPIPAQQYTGSAVTPALTITCGSNILVEGADYTVTYSNNVNIGTATATINAAKNSNYTGSTSAQFSIGNDVGGFIISGFAPSYNYTGAAITPGVVVETGSTTLTQGVDYTVSYADNVNAGTATIKVTGIGKYSGTQTATFVIAAKNIQSCDTTEVTDQAYTGDAYTPSITVSDGEKVLQNGVDYTITYANNTNPGVASVIIQGIGNNYSGVKTINFRIASAAVQGLKASSIKYSSLKLSWTKQGYADGYQVCDSNSKVVENVTKNSVSITGLSSAKTYKYKVRSYTRNADGSRSYSAFSPLVSATTKLKTPTVKITSTKKAQARIKWSKVSGATGYEIYYKKSAGAKYKKVKTINNANTRICNVRGLKSGSKAYFRVRAFKKSGSKKIYSSLNPLKVIKIK